VHDVWGHLARGNGRVEYGHRHLDVLLLEVAEGIIAVVDVATPVKGFEIRSLKGNYITALVKTIVWMKSTDNGTTVVPVVNPLKSVLLSIHRY